MAIADAFKRLFGNGSSPKTRATSAMLDSYGPDDMPDGCLAALWELHWNRQPRTPQLITEARRAMNGQSVRVSAPEWDVDDLNAFRTGGPDAWERPRKTAKRLSYKKSRVKRPVARLGPTAQKESTRIEQWVNAALDQTFPDYPVTELSLNEGPTLMICHPTLIGFEQVDTLYDEFEQDAEHISESDFAAIPDDQKSEYARASAPSDEPRYKRIRQKYRRTSSGERAKETEPADLKQTTKEYEQTIEDMLARRFPIAIRLVSRLDFVPLDPSWGGKYSSCDGALIRTLYRRSRLKASYRWEGCDELVEPTGADGRDGEFFLYELWAYDSEQRPYCAYQVGTQKTSWADDDSIAVIRLDEAFPGLTELPISFEYGDYVASSDPDMRSLPFAIPFIDNWRQRDSIMNTMAVSVAKYGYPSFVQEMTPDSLAVLDQLGGDVDLEFQVAPNTVKPVVGKIVPLTPAGAGPNVGEMLSALNEMNERELPQPGAFGGEGPTSGLDRSIQGRDLEIIHGPVIESVRRHKEKMGRYMLMIGSAIGQACGKPIEIYAIGTAPTPSGTTQTQNRISLPPDICDDNWDVVAQFEVRPGENLAQSSLFLEALAQGAILMREYREWALGDENPEQFVYEKIVQDFLTSPTGQADIIQGMAAYLGEQRITEMMQLAQGGRITSPQGGVSTAAMGTLVPPGGAPPGPPNTGLVNPGNPAQSQLAGANAGAMQASAGAAGSPLDGQVVA